MTAARSQNPSPDTLPLYASEPAWTADNTPPPALSAGPDAMKLLKALQRRWLLAVGLGLILGGAAAVGAWYGLTPPHTATAQVHISFVRPRVGSDPVESQREFAVFQKLQANQIKSRAVLTEAIKRDEMRAYVLEYAGPDPILWLQDELKVEFQEGSEVMTLSMSGRDPSKVVTVLNAILAAYMQVVVDKEKDQRSRRLEDLEKIVTENSDALQKKVNDMRGLAERLGTGESAAAVQKQVALLGLLTEKKRQQASLQFDLLRLNTRLEDHKTTEPLPKDLTVPESMVNQALSGHPRAASHLGMISRAEERISAYEAVGARSTESGYELARDLRRKAQKAIEDLKSEIRAELLAKYKEEAVQNHAALGRVIENEIKPLARQAEEIKAEVERLTVEVEKLGKSSTELEQLRAEIRGDEGRLQLYRDQLADLKLEVRAPQRITKYQDAALQKQDNKKQLLATAGAPVTVLLFVCAVIGWWESRARRIHTADEVAGGLGIRVVGAVPALARAARNASPEEESLQLHGLLESIDGIRTVLLREANLDSSMKVVMVSSAVAGEGKTTLACHLAGSLARAGRRTLLIDCDLRNPTAHQLFELPQMPGFSEVLLNEVHVAEATLSTQVDGLWVIPGGLWDREVVQELAKEGVTKLFEKLRREYDFIILDSHPVLAATDSLLLGQHADAVILSLMREVSQSPRVYQACQKLHGLGIRMLGAVVNGLPEGDVYVAGSRRAARAVA